VESGSFIWDYFGATENAGVENSGVKKASKTGKRGSGKRRSGKRGTRMYAFVLMCIKS